MYLCVSVHQLTGGDVHCVHGVCPPVRQQDTASTDTQIAWCLQLCQHGAVHHRPHHLTSPCDEVHTGRITVCFPTADKESVVSQTLSNTNILSAGLYPCGHSQGGGHLQQVDGGFVDCHGNQTARQDSQASWCFLHCERGGHGVWV